MAERVSDCLDVRRNRCSGVTVWLSKYTKRVAPGFSHRVTRPYNGDGSDVTELSVWDAKTKFMDRTVVFPLLPLLTTWPCQRRRAPTFNILRPRRIVPRAHRCWYLGSNWSMSFQLVGVPEPRLAATVVLLHLSTPARMPCVVGIPIVGIHLERPRLSIPSSHCAVSLFSITRTCTLSLCLSLRRSAHLCKETTESSLVWRQTRRHSI